jgi:hypothetical protein
VPETNLWSIKLGKFEETVYRLVTKIWKNEQTETKHFALYRQRACGI